MNIGGQEPRHLYSIPPADEGVELIYRSNFSDDWTGDRQRGSRLQSPNRRLVVIIGPGDRHSQELDE